MDNNSTPQPPQPNAPYQQPINQYSQQPQQPMPQPNPAPVARVNYDSNPFVATAKGLGTMLTHNPISVLLTQIIPVLLAIGLVVVDSITEVIGLPVILRVLILLILTIFLVVTSVKAMAAGIAILHSSMQGRAISTKEAMNAYSPGRLTALVLTSLLAGFFAGIGLILFVIPGLIIIGRVSLLPFVVLVEGLSGFAAIKRSLSLTKGHVFEMWGVLIAQSILSGNGLLALPASVSGIGSRYSQLKAAKELNAPTGRMHFMNWLLPTMILVFTILYIAFIVVLVSFSSIDTNQNYRFDQDYRYDPYLPERRTNTL